MSANNTSPKTWRILIALAFLTLIYFPIFLRLDHKPLRMWDEARNAINALEMTEDHSFMVKHFGAYPDLWETKPPLLVWLQVAGFETLGYGELSVRLPSALATLALCIFLPVFFSKRFKAPIIGALASLVIVTAQGYIHDHAARTGDHDAMLVCFEMIMLCCFFTYTETRDSRSLNGAAVCLALAMYAKGISVMMLFPGIALYLLFSRKLALSIKDVKLWKALGLALLSIALYYAVRELISAGYLKAVWQNELFPRYFNSARDYQYNVSDFWYYWDEMRSYHFGYWLWFLFPAILINIVLCREQLRRLHNFILVNSVVFFAIISRGTTNVWYMLPLIPMFAMIIGIALYQLGLLLYKYIPTAFLGTPICLVACFAIFYYPYTNIIKKNMDTAETNGQVEYAYIFRRLERQMPEIRNIAVYDPVNWNHPLMFYRDWYNRHKHYKIRYVYEIEPARDKYVIALAFQLDELKEKGIRYKIVFSEFECYLIRIM